MQVIKFRAWDKLRKRYEHWAAAENRYDGIFWDMIKRPEFDNPEQFIGSRAKNGKEIYAGHIVNWTLDEIYDAGEKTRTLFGRKEIITWEPEHACFGCRGQGAGYRGSNFFEDATIEIIGNIHENPELLKGESQ